MDRQRIIRLMVERRTTEWSGVGCRMTVIDDVVVDDGGDGK
jgi:hypothetical protein